MPVISKCQIMDLIESALTRNGLPQAMAARSAAIVAKELWCRYSGAQLYFVKGRPTSNQRCTAIFASFTGANQLELAQEYNLSVRRIEQIIAEEMKKKSR